MDREIYDHPATGPARQLSAIGQLDTGRVLSLMTAARVASVLLGDA